MLSSHVKRSWLLWLHDTSRLSQQKKCSCEMVWHFIGVYIINRTLHDRLEMRNFSSRVEKYFTRWLHSLMKYFSTLKEKFPISVRPCNILYLFDAVLAILDFFCIPATFSMYLIVDKFGRKMFGRIFCK